MSFPYYDILGRCVFYGCREFILSNITFRVESKFLFTYTYDLILSSNRFKFGKSQDVLFLLIMSDMTITVHDIQI